MTLIKTSVLSGIAVLVRVASALVINKILAVYVGPAGYAVVGQFQNIVSIFGSLAGGVAAVGVTKLTAENAFDDSKQHDVWKTAGRISLWASAIAGLSLLLFDNRLAEWLWLRGDADGVLFWLALSLPAIAANNLLLAIVNGKKEVGIYVTANCVGALIGVLVTGGLAYKFGLYGALVAYTINPAVTLLATGALVSRKSWFKASALWGGINRPAARRLGGFVAMALTSALMVPITHMLIRDHLATTLGQEAAGYWQGLWKISEIYLMLITSTLAVYYLPRIAEISTGYELKTEITRAYRYLLPLAIVGSLTIYLSRDLIIDALFTKEFAPMRDLFAWQLTGDVIKIGSWMLGYVLVGRAMVKLFIFKEIGVNVLFFTLSMLLVDRRGLDGVVIAYVIMYMANWLLLVVIVRYEIRRMETH